MATQTLGQQEEVSSRMPPLVFTEDQLQASVIMCTKSRKPTQFELSVSQTVSRFELITVRNPPSIAVGYNRGAMKSKHGILLFTHDDVSMFYVERTWCSFVAQLRNERSGIGGVVGYRYVDGKNWLPMEFASGAVKHTKGTEAWLSKFGPFGDTIILDGVFLAMTRKLFFDLGGFDEDYKGFHFYDIDISFRAFQKGYKNFTFPLAITHDRTNAKPVTGWLKNEEIFMKKWGSQLPKTMKIETDLNMPEELKKFDQPARDVVETWPNSYAASNLDSVPNEPVQEEKAPPIGMPKEEVPFQFRKPEEALPPKPINEMTDAEQGNYINNILGQFQLLYYHGHGMVVHGANIHNPITSAVWMGLSIGKTPLDLFVYQEILFDTRPDLIIEAGTAAGASGLFLAQMCQLMNTGNVVSIDVRHPPYLRQHDRLTYVKASITDPETRKTVERMMEMAPVTPRVMIIFDDDHGKDHVIEEMEMWCDLVSPGCYMIIEDTNINGNPVFEGFGPGPNEAVKDFLPRHPEFYPDYSRQKFLMSMNPGGYLRRL